MSIHLLYTLTFLALFSSATDPGSKKAALVIQVNGDEECTGKVWFALCSNAAEFEEERGGIVRSGLMRNGKMHLQLVDIEAGNYAVKLFVDKNQNDVLDQGLLGIPKEPYGFSNDAMGLIGPPSFNDARFRIEAGTTRSILINLRGR